MVSHREQDALERAARLACAVLLVPVLCGCAPTQAPARSPSPATVSQPAGPTGRVLISVSDPAADEGMAWHIALSPDGRFVGENTWSDGATSFRSDCGGSLSGAQVRQWFGWVREHATLSSPERPAGPRDFGKLEVSLAYEDEGGTVRHVPLAGLDATARAWAESLTGSCL